MAQAHFESPRIAATALDWAIDAISAHFVPDIQLVLDFDDPSLDASRLRRAHRLLFDAEPILGCRYVRGPLSTCWRRLGKGELDSAPLTVREGQEQDWLDVLQHFLAEPLDITRGPGLRALLFQTNAASHLAIKVHHLVADTGATKQIGYRLAQLYRQLEREPAYRPTPNPGSRRLSQVYWNVVKRGGGLGLVRRSVRTSRDMSHPLKSLALSLGSTEVGRPRFVLWHLEEKRGALLREYAKARSGTINDVIVAAVLRAYVRSFGRDPHEAVRLLTTVDLRRYLSGKSAPGICNLSAFAYVNLGKTLGVDFERTFGRVKARMDCLKKDYLGLGLHLTTILPLLPLPNMVARSVLRSALKLSSTVGNQGPGLTNLGPIDAAALNFGEALVQCAYVVVPASRPPALVLGVSGFRGSLTFSMGHYASSVSSSQVQRLFDHLDDELPGG